MNLESSSNKNNLFQINNLFPIQPRSHSSAFGQIAREWLITKVCFLRCRVWHVFNKYNNFYKCKILQLIANKITTLQAMALRITRLWINLNRILVFEKLGQTAHIDLSRIIVLRPLKEPLNLTSLIRRKFCRRDWTRLDWLLNLIWQKTFTASS